MKLQASPVKQCALDHGIAVAQPRSLRLDGKYPEDAAAARDALLAAQADVMVVAAYGLILPQWVLDVMSAARPPEGAKAPLGGSAPRAAGERGGPIFGEGETSRSEWRLGVFHFSYPWGCAPLAASGDWGCFIFPRRWPGCARPAP